MLVEGVIRVSLLIGYFYVIGLIPDLNRVFQYHAAEHKAINAYEDGAELTAGARRASTDEAPPAVRHELPDGRYARGPIRALLSVVRFDSLAANALSSRIWRCFPLRRRALDNQGHSARPPKSARESGALFKIMVAPGLWLQHIHRRGAERRDQLEVAIPRPARRPWRWSGPGGGVASR